MSLFMGAQDDVSPASSGINLHLEDAMDASVDAENIGVEDDVLPVDIEVHHF